MVILRNSPEVPQLQYEVGSIPCRVESMYCDFHVWFMIIHAWSSANYLANKNIPNHFIFISQRHNLCHHIWINTLYEWNPIPPKKGFGAPGCINQNWCTVTNQYLTWLQSCCSLWLISLCTKWISLHRSMKVPRCIKGALRKAPTALLCCMTTAAHIRQRVIDQHLLLSDCCSWIWLSKLTLWTKLPLQSSTVYWWWGQCDLNSSEAQRLLKSGNKRTIEQYNQEEMRPCRQVNNTLQDTWTVLKTGVIFER